MRAAKPQVFFSMRMDKEISERLEAFSKRTGSTKTKIVEIALKQYFDKMEKLVSEIYPD